MSVQSCSRCAAVVVTTAFGIMSTGVCPVPQAFGQRNDGAAYRSVTVPLLSLAGLEFGLAATDSASAEAAVAEVPGPAEATQAVASAAATTLVDVLYDVARNIVFAASIAVLPAWWIAFPVTFPIGYYVGERFLFPSSAGLPGLRTIGIILSAVALPPVLAGRLLPELSTSTGTATQTASTEQSPPVSAAPAASAASLTDAAKTSTDVSDVAVVDLELKSVAAHRATRERSPRSEAVPAPSPALPAAATVAHTPGPQSTVPEVAPNASSSSADPATVAQPDPSVGKGSSANRAGPRRSSR